MASPLQHWADHTDHTKTVQWSLRTSVGLRDKIEAASWHVGDDGFVHFHDPAGKLVASVRAGDVEHIQALHEKTE